MKIVELKKPEGLKNASDLDKHYNKVNALIHELDKKNLPPTTLAFINQEIQELNATALTGNSFKKLLLRKRTNIIKRVEKEHKIVPKNYYRDLWLALGMAAFGLPLGAAFGASMGNMGLMGLGLPIGLAIGLALGTGMDDKALKEGRQLNIEIKSRFSS